MTQEALKLALEALENELSIDWTNNDEFNASAEKMYEAIAVIKEALAQPEQEPVATVTSETGADITMSWWHEPALPIGTKLYTHPPQRTEQEPVAWMDADGNTFPFVWNVGVQQGSKYLDETLTPLYTYPPQRTWVGLEGEEIRNFWEEATKPDRSTMTMVTSFARAIEAKLKEKNT